MRKIMTADVQYDSQNEFADHIKDMLNDGYIVSNINFKEKDKEHFTVSYRKREEVFPTRSSNSGEGRWIYGREYLDKGITTLRSADKDIKVNTFTYYCSACLKEAAQDTEYGELLFQYCPHCGAKMHNGDIVDG